MSGTAPFKIDISEKSAGLVGRLTQCIYFEEVTDALPYKLVAIG